MVKNRRTEAQPPPVFFGEKLFFIRKTKKSYKESKMATLNRTLFIGRLGQDPTLTNKNGLDICNFSIAVSEKYKDKSGQMGKTEWVNIVTFKNLASLCAKYLAKGKEVYVEGKMQTDRYEKDGVQMYRTKIIAQNVQFLSGRQDNNQQAQEPQATTSARDAYEDTNIPF